MSNSWTGSPLKETGNGAKDWIPYLGIGFYAEFGNTGHDDENESNNSYDHGISCALSEWGIMVKGGVSFD